jgi:predicted O-methyltransferase YrrM
MRILTAFHRWLVLQPSLPPRLSWAIAVLIERLFFRVKKRQIFDRFELTQDWFSDGESIWRFLLEDVRGKPEISALEIGTFEGRSAVWLLTQILVHPTSRLTCVDPLRYPEVEARLQKNLENAGALNRVRLIRKSSKEAALELKSERFDLVYVDGSHDYDDVRFDCSLALEVLKYGGFLIVDDYLWKGHHAPYFQVKRAVDEFRALHRRQFRILYRGYQVFLLKL